MRRILFIIFPFLLIGMLDAQQLAFPGAEGFGKYTKGGRGGIVVKVSNLNDSGTGSLRDALNGSAYKGKKRTIVFTVSGTIALNSQITVVDSFITIAGQTAPGDGICIKNYPIYFSASKEIIVRYIRSRLGDQQSAVAPNCDYDAMSVRKCHHLIIDHCSMSWSIDDVLDLTVETGHSTVQWCILSEPLINSKHSKGAHGYIAGWDGNSWGDNNTFGGGSYHHNILASGLSRTPRLDSYAGEFNTGHRDLFDVVNNVIYNWHGQGAYGGEAADVNWQNNYYKPGPNTAASISSQIFLASGYTYMYVNGNYIEGNSSVTSNNKLGIFPSSVLTVDQIVKSTRFQVENINIQSATDAYSSVLSNAGASLPKRDAVDSRVVSNISTGTGTGIDSQNQVGGWPTLNSTTPPADTDNDGMPDAWETAKGLNPNNATDGNNVGSDGFTMLEKYLNSIGIVPTSVSLNQTTASINVGATVDLNETVLPSNATDKSVIWSSNNTSVATVNSTGLVTGIATGTATITVKTIFGSNTATCAVTVTASGSIVSGGTYSLTARHSGKVIGIKGGSTANSALAEQQTNTSKTYQQFILTDVGSGYYRISPTSITSSALDVDRKLTNDGVNIIQYTYNGGTNQQWQFVNLGTGYYQIKSRLSGKCLDVNGGWTGDGATIIQWTCGTGYNQQWSLSRLKSSFESDKLIPELPAKSIIAPNPASDGMFKLTLPGDITNGTLSIYNLQGGVVYRQAISGNNIVVNSQLTPGIYLVKINIENITTHTEKLIIR